jgi:hypothetical protein
VLHSFARVTTRISEDYLGYKTRANNTPSTLNNINATTLEMRHNDFIIYTAIVKIDVLATGEPEKLLMRF